METIENVSDKSVRSSCFLTNIGKRINMFSAATVDTIQVMIPKSVKKGCRLNNREELFQLERDKQPEMSPSVHGLMLHRYSSQIVVSP